MPKVFRSLLLTTTWLALVPGFDGTAFAEPNDAKPKPEAPAERVLACSATQLEDGVLSECIELSAPKNDEAAVKKAQDGCRAMLTASLAPKWKEENPGETVSVSMTTPCQVDRYFTRCEHATSSSIGGLSRYYDLADALKYKDDCGKGKWSENPEFKAWLRPKKMTAVTLLKDWRSNQAKALSEFSATPMEFTGTVSQVRVSDDGNPIVLLRAGGAKTDVVGLGGVGMEEASTLVVGKSVTFARCFLEGGAALDIPIVVCDVDRRPWD